MSQSISSAVTILSITHTTIHHNLPFTPHRHLRTPHTTQRFLGTSYPLLPSSTNPHPADISKSPSSAQHAVRGLPKRLPLNEYEPFHTFHFFPVQRYTILMLHTSTCASSPSTILLPNSSLNSHLQTVPVDLHHAHHDETSSLTINSALLPAF